MNKKNWQLVINELVFFQIGNPRGKIHAHFKTIVKFKKNLRIKLFKILKHGSEENNYK